MQTLFEKLRRIGNVKIWLDTEELQKTGQVDPESLKIKVESSVALLVFLSQGYLAAPFCQTELRAANNAQIPIIIVCDDDVTKDMLEKEIEEFKTAKEQDMREEDTVTLQDMTKLTKQAFPEAFPEDSAQDSERVNEKPADKVDHDGNDSGVLWWSRDPIFVRMALKGVVQQLLKHDLQLPPPPKAPELLFHDELIFRRKWINEKKEVSLFVSSDYPKVPSIERAFKKAGENLGIEVSISSAREDGMTPVLLLCPDYFLNEGLWEETFEELNKEHLEGAPAACLLYSTDMSLDMTTYMKEAKKEFGDDEAGKEKARKVFTPLWSAWPKVSSLQTVAAEAQLKAQLKAQPVKQPSRAPLSFSSSAKTSSVTPSAA